MVKFYNGRKLVLTVTTNNPSRVIREMQESSMFAGINYTWTRYKII